MVKLDDDRIDDIFICTDYIVNQANALDKAIQDIVIDKGSGAIDWKVFQYKLRMIRGNANTIRETIEQAQKENSK